MFRVGRLGTSRAVDKASHASQPETPVPGNLLGHYHQLPWGLSANSKAYAFTDLAGVGEDKPTLRRCRGRAWQPIVTMNGDTCQGGRGSRKHGVANRAGDQEAPNKGGNASSFHTAYRQRTLGLDCCDCSLSGLISEATQVVST